MLHAVIMAGGSGTRFWPESREARPKQLLRLTGERSMLQSTVDRLSGLVSDDRILVVTGRGIAAAVSEQLPQLKPNQILAEPCRRDTAPCIGWAALAVAQHDPDATLVVLPSDHVIEPVAEFRRAVEHAVRLIEAEPDRIVTFGIKPTYPAAIYGYIERGEAISGDTAAPASFRAVRFREKPQVETAREYLAAGTFYWNSGIFVWKARTILDALAKQQPAMLEHLERIVKSSTTNDAAAVLEREFTAIRGISIDYAVLEQATNIVVVEAPFTWDDVGSWQAIARLRGTDEQGNTVLGRHVGVNTDGCIVRSNDEHVVVTLGLKDCLVVHTDGATFVANKHDEEAVREVVRQLRERGWTDVL